MAVHATEADSLVAEGLGSGRRSRRRRGMSTAAWIYRLYGVSRTVRIAAHVLCFLVALYIVVPLYWILVAATKNNTNIVNGFGFWFQAPFHLFHNITGVFSYNSSVFSRWLLNTVFYAGVSGILATFVAALAGYVFAKYHFFGRRPIMALIIGAVAIPSTALVIPLYLMFSKAHLTNDPFGLILGSLGGAFGAFLIFIYARAAIDDDLLDAARIDGASEFRIFWQIGVPLIMPGCVTVLLFAVVGTWNNYFLPLLLFTNQRLYPVTLGLAQWNFSLSSGYGRNVLYSLLVTGGIISMIPTIVIFTVLQRYWRSGITTGAVRQ